MLGDLGLPMLLLSAEDLEQVLDMRTVIDAVERGLVEHARGTVSMPARHVIGMGEGRTLFTMSAFLAGMGTAAVKVVADIQDNVARGLPSISGAVVLVDGETGRPRCLLDGATVTRLRTGAASALAARSLSLVDASVVGILGSGVQARTQVAGLWTVRDVQVVKAYSPTKAHLRAFCEEMVAELGVDAVVVDGPEEVVEEADIVVTATNASSPVLQGSWLEPGIHVNAIGGGPVRELDPEVYRIARVVVDWREGALHEAADLQDAIAAEVFTPEDIYGELGELVAGLKSGRKEKEEITLFRSVGMALEDAATAAVAYERARAEGIGQELPF